MAYFGEIVLLGEVDELLAVDGLVEGNANDPEALVVGGRVGLNHTHANFHPMTKPKIVIVGLSIVSAVAIGFAFFYRVMAGVFLADSNFETFRDVLTSEQQKGITWSLDAITSSYCWLLVITNVLWMVGASYLLHRLRVTQARTA
jgi:hypothetical protein